MKLQPINKVKLVSKLIYILIIFVISIVAFKNIVKAAPPEPDTFILTHPASVSNNGSDTFAFDASESPVTFECRLDAGAFNPCTSPYSASSLTEGPHTFYVRAVDASDVADPSPATYAWTVDRTPPDTTITRLGSTPSTTSVTNFILTSNEVATYQCSLDSASFESCDSSYATPSLTDGEHTLIVKAVDAAGNNDLTPAVHTWTVDTSHVDSDNDGTYDVVENAGPNGGDANNDGIADASQANVVSFINPLTGNYQVLETDCTSLANIQVGSESSESADNQYTYPAGLTQFWATCASPGVTAHIYQYYFGVKNNSNLALRKWHGDGSYSTVNNAIFNEISIGGHEVLKISYTAKDGGSLDDDGSADGVIRDPSGPGLLVSSIKAPNTGSGTKQPTGKYAMSSLALIFIGSVSFGLIKIRTSKS